MSTAPRSPVSRPAAPKPQIRDRQPSPNDKADSGKAVGSQPCTHPRVQIVARQQDSEFVECLECREVFDSSEFRDMQIEEKIHQDPAE